MRRAATFANSPFGDFFGTRDREFLASKSAPRARGELAEPADHVAAVWRGDKVAVRVWLEGGGRANATRELRVEEGQVTTGVTLLMDAASGIPTVGSIWGTVGCGH